MTLDTTDCMAERKSHFAFGYAVKDPGGLFKIQTTTKRCIFHEDSARKAQT